MMCPLLTARRAKRCDAPPSHWPPGRLAGDAVGHRDIVGVAVTAGVELIFASRSPGWAVSSLLPSRPRPRPLFASARVACPRDATLAETERAKPAKRSRRARRNGASAGRGEAAPHCGKADEDQVFGRSRGNRRRATPGLARYACAAAAAETSKRTRTAAAGKAGLPGEAYSCS